MNTTNKSGQQIIDDIKAKVAREKQTTLIECLLPTQAVVKLIPLAKQMGITILIEKKDKEDLVLLEVQRINNMRIYLLQTLCGLLKEQFSRSYDVSLIYGRKIQEVLNLLQAT